jgi:molybdenum cofactor guanylyltransferase
MGRDKAFLPLGNVTLLEHTIDTIRQVCNKVVLVGDRERLLSFGDVIEDRFGGQGPLAGIHAALSSEWAQEWNVVLAVDTPAVNPRFLQFLFDKAQASSALVTVPRANGHTQPLCAVYRQEFAAMAEEALRAGRNKIDPLFSSVATRVLEEEELKAMGFPPDIFDNVNTPEDWKRMQQRLGVTET